MRTINQIVIHHSASPRWTTINEIDGWHRAKGWDGCGYHFVVEGDGDVKPGRPIESTGAHVMGKNDNTIGVCVTGHNDRTGMQWTPRQIRRLTRLVLRLIKDHGLTPLDVVGHSEIAEARPTDCPGLTFSMDRYRRNLRRRINNRSAPGSTLPPSPDPGVDLACEVPGGDLD